LEQPVPSDRDDLATRIATVINAQAWADMRHILETDPELTTAAALAVLDGRVDQVRADPESARALRGYQGMLRECGEKGIASYFDEQAAILAHAGAQRARRHRRRTR
jgi:hypothetical protein